jgi:hypothetical protein
VNCPAPELAHYALKDEEKIENREKEKIKGERKEEEEEEQGEGKEIVHLDRLKVLASGDIHRMRGRGNRPSTQTSNCQLHGT